MILKNLIIIGAGPEQVPAYKFAIEMGLRTIGVDKNPSAPGFNISDDKIIANVYKPKECLEKVIKYSNNINFVFKYYYFSFYLNNIIFQGIFNLKYLYLNLNTTLKSKNKL